MTTSIVTDKSINKKLMEIDMEQKEYNMYLDITPQQSPRKNSNENSV